MPSWVLTGANRGLGLEFVRQLSASAENTLFLGVRDLQSDLSDLKSLTSSAKATTHILEADSASRDSLLAFAGSVIKNLGSSGRLDYLLNNAGINANATVPILAEANQGSGGAAPPSTAITAEMLNEHMAINVLGPTILAAALDPVLGDGSVVLNMTSGLGSLGASKGMSPRKCPVYSTSKAALDMMTLHLEGEWRAKGKKVITILMDPGWVKTRMGGDGAVLEPHESISGMLKTVRGVKDGDSGKFYTYTGKEVPW